MNCFGIQIRSIMLSPAFDGRDTTESISLMPFSTVFEGKLAMNGSISSFSRVISNIDEVLAFVFQIWLTKISLTMLILVQIVGPEPFLPSSESDTQSFFVTLG